MYAQRVDGSHDIVGFIPTWIRELSKKVETLHVITPYYNEKTRLPENVKIYRLSRVTDRFPRFTKTIAEIIYLNKILIGLFLQKKIDVIFCHMSADYAIRMAPVARLFRIPIVSWHTHGHVSRRLRLAHFLSDKMVTASRESLRIASDKIIVTGHGIDTDRFKPMANLDINKKEITILSVGRISPIKDYETLIKAADTLINEDGIKDLEFIIVGGVPLASQEKYYEWLKQMVKELKLEDKVKFIGPVPYDEVVSYYQGCDIFVTTSQTGSVDKTVLEAMACEKPVITSIGAFKNILGAYSKDLMFKGKNPADLAEKLAHVIQMDENLRHRLGSDMRHIVEEAHRLDTLAGTLVDIFDKVSNRRQG